MNRAHLGDALDHWKGSVIEVISDKKLQVVPMLTDRDQWTQEDFETYARLLHRKPEDVLKNGEGDLFSSRTRHRYFRDLVNMTGEHDLFLDPDTGIAPDEKAQKQHVRPSEIAGLISQSRSRILLIYQHASREKDGLVKKLKLLRRADCLLLTKDSQDAPSRYCRQLEDV
jgi:hypothetical protein